MVLMRPRTGMAALNVRRKGRPQVGEARLWTSPLTEGLGGATQRKATGDLFNATCPQPHMAA
jgi:hypothetical protein